MSNLDYILMRLKYGIGTMDNDKLIKESKEYTEVYSESNTELNGEKSREVYCKYCQAYATTSLLAPKCMICKHEMITVVK